MTDHPRQPADPHESEQVFADDVLVEAARAGWLCGSSPDALAGMLAALRDRADGRCSCGRRGRCRTGY